MKNHLKILHLEDEESDAEIIERFLKKSGMDFKFLCVNNRVDFKSALENYNPDIILCDHMLPAFTSMDALHIVKNTKSRIPFILVTGRVSEEFSVDMMKEGIDDYLIKDRLQRLPNAIHSALEKVRAEKEKEKHYEELLRQERKFRALIENSHEGIVLNDAGLKTIYRSPSATRITGWSNQDLQDRSFIELVHPDDKLKLQDLIKKTLRMRGIPFNDKVRVHTEWQKYIWIDLTVTNLLHDPSVAAIVTNFRDISAKKRTEDELEKTGKHFQALIENISDAIVLVDDLGKIQYQSPSTSRILGTEFEENIGKSIVELFHPEEVRGGRKFFENVLKNPEVPIQHTSRVRHKKGHYIWVEGTITNLLHDDSVRALVINYREVTERKISEMLLQKSEANMRTIFDNTNIAYVFTDKNFNLVSYNKLAAEGYKNELGVDLKEGENLINYQLPERREQAKKHYEAVLAGQKVNYEVDFVHPDNGITWFNVNILPVHNEQKEILGLIVSSEDITQRKNLELEREKITHTLIQRNKDLEQFSYIVSHNLRSPVANIIGLTDIILTGDFLDPGDMKKCMEGLGQSVNRLDEVIKDLNYILQVRKEVKEKREPVGISELVSDIKASISNLVDHENIVLQTDFSEIDEIHTIKGYFQSILYNLISNSIRYRKATGVTLIRISTHIIDNKILIRVSDNGLGIDLEANKGKVFGLYKKFHNNTDGKGMGLYMVKTQVQILGGSISIESEVNKGTTFTIEFERPMA